MGQFIHGPKHLVDKMKAGPSNGNSHYLHQQFQQHPIQNENRKIEQTQPKVSQEVKIIEKEVIKYIELPIIKEVPVEVIKEIKVIEEKIVEVIKEVPVEVIKEVKVIEEKIVEVIKEVPVEVKVIEEKIIKIEQQILEKVPMWAKITMVLELALILGLLFK